MCLPPVLLKRLALRGLIDPNAKQDKIKNSSVKKPQPAAIIQDLDNEYPLNEDNNEEIIAEDYDDDEDPSFDKYEPIKKPQESFWIERMKKRIVEGSGLGYKGCPNKYNIFHKCTLFCINRWGDGIVEPDEEYIKRQKRLLEKYPLPDNWVEVYDHGCGAHYYWNEEDDNVSWLPPDHPDSQISKSAAVLRHELEEVQINDGEEESNSNDEISVSSNVNNSSAGISAQEILDLLNEKIQIQAATAKRPNTPPSLDDILFPPLKKSKTRDLDKKSRNKQNKLNKNKSDLNPLDPMDPASYSDIPRGKWSDGLTNDGNKTGIDPTASGTIFQMRPYPSPGAVLQSNAALSSSSSSVKSKKHNSHLHSSSESDED